MSAATPLAASDDAVVIVPLSPLDAIMAGPPGLTVVYIFPPPAPGTQAPYDLERVHAAFISTIEEDYPLFIGKPHVDPKTGAVGIAQTTATRAAGAQGMRFFTDKDCELTTDDAVRLTPMAFLPAREREQETLTMKATLLCDGGLALGFNGTHVLLDGQGLFTFFKV